MDELFELVHCHFDELVSEHFSKAWLHQLLKKLTAQSRVSLRHLTKYAVERLLTEAKEPTQKLERVDFSVDQICA